MPDIVGSPAAEAPLQPPTTAPLPARSKEELETAEVLLKYGHSDRSQYDIATRPIGPTANDISPNTFKAVNSTAASDLESHNVVRNSVETTASSFQAHNNGQVCR